MNKDQLKNLIKKSLNIKKIDNKTSIGLICLKAYKFLFDEIHAVDKYTNLIENIINQNDFKIRSSQALFLLTKSKSVIHDIANECSNSLINKIVLKSLKDFIKDKTNLLYQ